MAAPRPVLKLHKRTNDIIAFANHVVQFMTDNPNFTAPDPPLATLQSDIDALSRAQSAVLSRTRGTPSTRDACLANVRLDLQRLRAYVQTLATKLDAEQAESLIVSAGLYVKKKGIHPKQRASATSGPVSGSVRLTAPIAGKRASYRWQYAPESGPWLPLANTLQASTRIDSLTPGTVYRFQARAVTRTGIGDWSEPVVFMAR
jgi:hypothetical protein